jgi:hypothetical protein
MKHNLKILLAIILVFMFCSVATAAKYKFRVAYTDAPRLKVGNEKLVHVTVAAVYAFDDSVNAMTGGAFDVQFKLHRQYPRLPGTFRKFKYFQSPIFGITRLLPGKYLMANSAKNSLIEWPKKATSV